MPESSELYARKLDVCSCGYCASYRSYDIVKIVGGDVVPVERMGHEQLMTDGERREYLDRFWVFEDPEFHDGQVETASRASSYLAKLVAKLRARLA